MEQPYHVMFSFQEIDDDNWKFGIDDITTPEPLSGREGVYELARAIGNLRGYSKVVINSTVPPIENIEEVLNSKTTNAFGQVIDGGANNEKS